MFEFNFAPILDVASRFTVAGLLLLIVVGLLRGWFVSGREYNELRRQRDQLKKELADAQRGADLGQRTDGPAAAAPTQSRAGGARDAEEEAARGRATAEPADEVV